MIHNKKDVKNKEIKKKQKIDNDYCIIDQINYYTFVDYVDTEKMLINNFFYKSKKYERLIYYDMNKWLTYLIDTYKNKKSMNRSIWEQYKIDANRSVIYINDKLLYNVLDIKDYIRKYKNIINVYILIILTQVIFVIPFTLIQNNIMKNKYILSELSSKDIYKYSKYIKDINKNNLYLCSFTKKDIIIKIIKYLRIFKLKKSNDKTISIVKINIEFSFKKNKYSIIKIKFIPVVL